MKLKPLQVGWVVGAGVLLVAALLDIGNLVAPPDWVWIVAPLAFLGWSLLAGPSSREIRAAQRQRRNVHG